MSTGANLLENQKLLSVLSGEVQGAVLIGFIETCIRLHILTPGEQRDWAGDIQQDGWYPLVRLVELQRRIASKFEDADIVLEKAGIEFIKKWIASMGNKRFIRSGLDFLLLQCDSWGYRRLVRNAGREVGYFELTNLDLLRGAARIASATPLNRSFEKGVIIGGMLATGDLCYVRVDNGADADCFEVDFKPLRILEEPPPIPGPGAEAFEPPSGLARQFVENLYWRYQGLIEEQRRDGAFWQVVNAGLARLAAESLEVSRRMKDLAHSDTLTGLPNRRGIFLALTQEYSRALRYDQPLSVAILDMDWFKRVNDTHGHLIGDEVLRRSASTLAGSLRLSDTVGRLGGEEFLIIFPGTPLAEAGRATEKLRLALAEVEFAGSAGPFHVTASFGVACLAWDNDNPMELLRRADCALYRAKEAGRNRVVCFDGARD